MLRERGPYSQPSGGKNTALTQTEQPAISRGHLPTTRASEQIRQYEPTSFERLLDKYTQRISHEQNEWLRANCGFNYDLIDPNTGRLDITMFNENHHNGPYSSNDERIHRAQIARVEKIFADVINPDEEKAHDMTPELLAESRSKFKKRRAFRLEKYKLNPDEKTPEQVAANDKRLLEYYQREVSQRETTHVEVVIMNVFAKMMGKDFLVVRSSLYDDYFNGVDMIMIDKKTGQVLCAFDDVRGITKTNDSNEVEQSLREKHKFATSYRDNIRGGKHLDYGVQLITTNNQTKLRRGKIDNLPIVTLSASARDITHVTESWLQAQRTAKNDATPTRAEKIFFERMLEQMSDQLLDIITRPTPPGVSPDTAEAAQKRAQDILHSIDRVKSVHFTR